MFFSKWKPLGVNKRPQINGFETKIVSSEKNSDNFVATIAINTNSTNSANIENDTNNYGTTSTNDTWINNGTTTNKEMEMVTIR